MTIKYVNGNALDAAQGIILHGVNCQYAMASGIAGQIRKKWPIVYEVFMDTEPVLGNVALVEVAKGLFVGNCYTQEYYGRRPSRYVSYWAVENCLKQATALGLPIHMPWIGCGLANGEKTIIKSIIEGFKDVADITVYEYDI